MWTRAGHQISSRELGLVGSHGNQKLQPFMVAFLRAQTGHAASSAGASAASADADVEDDDADDAADAKDAGAEDEDEDEAPRHVGRFRRQAGNRKRGGKDPDEMTGSWNPYAGKRSFFWGGGSWFLFPIWIPLLDSLFNKWISFHFFQQFFWSAECQPKGKTLSIESYSMFHDRIQKINSVPFSLFPALGIWILMLESQNSWFN